MGLFSKETCAFCGKEVGMMHRSKLQGGDFICTDCKYLTHPFIRIDNLNKESAKAVMEEVARDESFFQAANFRETTRRAAGKRYTFYDDYDAGLFALHTPETEKYKNHPIFYMMMVRPFDRNLAFSLQQGNTTAMPALSKSQYEAMITLEEKKNADGSPDGWVMKMPYFREHMNIEIRFPQNMKEDDVKYWYSTVRTIIVNYNTSTARLKMHQTNLYQTAGAVLKAAIKGEGTDASEDMVKEGIETANGINDGTVKRGLFGRLKK